MSETATQRVGQDPLQYVSDQLAELRAKGTAPKLRVVEGEQKPVCVIDGRGCARRRLRRCESMARVRGRCERLPGR